jgi:excinuclease ABC subunit C
MECFDIAIWQGEKPTAGRVVFDLGKPSKKDYRFYHLQPRPEGNNDFAFLREAFERRLEKGDLPDVFVVDGGKGQLSQFTSLLSEFKLNIPAIAIAKERVKSGFQSDEIEKVEERIFIPGRSNALSLSKVRPLLKILATMRDEAHRFSRKLHHKSFHENRLGNWIDEVPEIGVKTKEKILQKIDRSILELKGMSVEELAAHFGLNSKQAKNLFDQLQKMNIA